MKEFIGNDWDRVLGPVLSSESYQKLYNFLKEEYASEQIYPDIHHTFTAFKLTSSKDTKVIILGQDPHHNPGQVMGTSLLVDPGIALPPPLKNIHQGSYDDVGCVPVKRGYSEKRANQDMLLLNTALTVLYGHANDYQGEGWKEVTNQAIKTSSKCEEVVSTLWGKLAQNKIPLIDENKSVITKSAHLSPFLARYGFFGSRPFSRCSITLTRWGKRAIDW